MQLPTTQSRFNIHEQHGTVVKTLQRRHSVSESSQNGSFESMQCAGVSRAALPALALALAALLAGARAAGGCGDQPPAAVNHSSCIKLSKARNVPVQPHENCVSVNGRPVNVLLYWGSAPAHAATAVLHALLRYVLRYRRVRVVHGSHRTVDFARAVPFYPRANYSDLVIALSTAWEPGTQFPWLPREEKTVSLAGPWLYEFGNSSVPARCRLYARLSQAARSSPACLQYTRWTFYTNASVLALCGFEFALHPDNVRAANVTVVSGCEESSRRLEARAATAPVRVRSSSRAELLAALRAVERSVLFIDYDIWLEHSIKCSAKRRSRVSISVCTTRSVRSRRPSCTWTSGAATRSSGWRRGA